MALAKSEGLILRVLPFRDTSKIVTAYTAERGLVSLLAKGVRGPKPKHGAALELFAVTDLVYYHRDSRDLQLLSQALLLEAFLGLGGDLRRYAHASAVLELLLRVLSGQEPPGRLYPLSVRTLECLETAPLESLPTLFRAFAIKAVSFLGHRPELSMCVACGRQFEGYPGFAGMLGGVVCHECLPGVDGALRLAPGTLAHLQRLLRSPLADLYQSPAPPMVQREAARVLETFLGLNIERYEPLRSLRLVESISLN